MESWSDIYAPLIGRILLGAYFVFSGIQKALNFSAFADHLGSSGFPFSLYLAIAAISIETIVGIALVADVQTSASALVLATYLIITSAIFFRVTSIMDTQIFLANFAIIGGLLILAGRGSSRWSQKRRR